VRWFRGLVIVVPTWPKRKAMNSTLSHYLLRAVMRGGVFLGILVDLNVATEVSPEAGLDNDEDQHTRKRNNTPRPQTNIATHP